MTIAASRTCSECGKALNSSRSKTCSDVCRKRRQRRLAAVEINCDAAMVTVKSLMSELCYHQEQHNEVAAETIRKTLQAIEDDIFRARHARWTYYCIEL